MKMAYKLINDSRNANPFPASYVNASTRITLHEVTSTGQTFVLIEGRFMTEHKMKPLMETTWQRMHEALLAGLNTHLQVLHLHDRKLRVQASKSSLAAPNLGMPHHRNGGGGACIGAIPQSVDNTSGRSSSLTQPPTAVPIQRPTPPRPPQPAAYIPDFSDWAWPMQPRSKPAEAETPSLARSPEGAGAGAGPVPAPKQLSRRTSSSSIQMVPEVKPLTMQMPAQEDAAAGRGSQMLQDTNLRMRFSAPETSAAAQLAMATSPGDKSSSRAAQASGSPPSRNSPTAEGTKGAPSASGEARSQNYPIARSAHGGEGENHPGSKSTCGSPRMTSYGNNPLLHRCVSMHERQQGNRLRQSLERQSLSAPPVGVYHPPPTSSTLLLVPPSPFNSFNYGSIRQ